MNAEVPFEPVPDSNDDPHEKETAVEGLVKRFDIHIKQADERNKRLDTLIKQLKIYNRQALPNWLIYVLIIMAVSHVFNIAAILYLIQRLPH